MLFGRAVQVEEAVEHFLTSVVDSEAQHADLMLDAVRS